jgi:hypothetical protein
VVKQKNAQGNDETVLNNEDYAQLLLKMEAQASRIAELEEENCSLKDEIKELKEERGTKTTKCNQKQYDVGTRMMVYDAISCSVPTENVPTLMTKWSSRQGTTLSNVPHRSTVERMVRELGFLSEFVCADVLLSSPNSTLAFDATTQDGRHYNAIIITTPQQTLLVSLEELAGGTALDYATHILETLQQLATTHSFFSGGDVQTTHKRLVQNISNTMTDRCAANHAAIVLVEKALDKDLQELYCHLHPLDSISTCVRSALKAAQGPLLQGSCFGNDCIAGNLVLAVNKLR